MERSTRISPFWASGNRFSTTRSIDLASEVAHSARITSNAKDRICVCVHDILKPQAWFRLRPGLTLCDGAEASTLLPADTAVDCDELIIAGAEEKRPQASQASPTDAFSSCTSQGRRQVTLQEAAAVSRLCSWTESRNGFEEADELGIGEAIYRLMS